ncbi:MAG TPA: DNA mismatch repair endonuclease MutL [Pseudogracilibacillus sp.]|nr:DNA mismatch repair endonuclease MutL [Pseudogracilibacillus sp.]
MASVKIEQLPESLANKIAAGEVVERPASVVKELVENSIDAKSNLIRIEVEEAGLRKIAVSDDGEGMSKEDCKRAFLRHATSKIKYDTDLFHIKSLGFRGEALASIASVSKLTLKSSQGNEAATMLYLEGGEIVKETKAEARKGTEIIVEDLFYNTPARLKYVKSLHTELGRITDLVNRFALAYPNIRFELIHNGRTLFKTTGSNQVLQVINQIYGRDVARNIIQKSTSTLDFDIEAYVVKPEITRANRNYITLIVNGRYIRNFPLTQAIIAGYGTLLPIHRFPIAVLYITLDPVLVDVNVHPTKLEVRFSKEKELAKTIEQLVARAFEAETLIPKMTYKHQKKKPTEQEAFELFLPKDKSQETNKTKSIKEPHFNKTKVITNERIKDKQRAYSDDVAIIHNEEINQNNLLNQNKTEVANKSLDEEEIKKDRIPPLYPIGQLQGTYILAQNELGFYMIDQHAAQERIKYEFFKKKLGNPEHDTQQLLMPLQFHFTLEEKLLLEQYADELESIGIKLEPFGGQTFTIRSHPTWFPKGEEEQLIRDIIQQVIEQGKVNFETLREEVAILMACKRSIKANHYLSIEEMERLLEDLRKTEDPFTCPHGRPVIIHQTYYEIEKMFKRIQ